MSDQIKQNLITQISQQATKWRQHFHQHPELGMEEKATSQFIAKKLKSWGVKVYLNIGGCGLVGELTNGNGKNNLAIRSEMDALPIQEQNSFAHCSKNKGVMHACGHDGHMAILLATAQYLAATKNFTGTIYFIFQPGEEGFAGAKKMIDDGLFKKFPIKEVYALHNTPNLDFGVLATNEGALLASANRVKITLIGKGTHAAHPHKGKDCIVAASEMVLALQTIISRKISPMDQALFSITQFSAGNTYNVIPGELELKGSFRSFSPEVDKTIKQQIEKICLGIGQAHEIKCQIEYPGTNYPVTINHSAQTKKAIEVAKKIVTKDQLITKHSPVMGAEDFAFMLEQKPGCMLSLGIGQDRAQLHNPNYDFNDEIILLGIKYWVALTENLLA